MLSVVFLVGFGVVGSLGLLLASMALSNLRDEGASAALNSGALLVVLAMIGAAVVLF